MLGKASSTSHFTSIHINKTIQENRTPTAKARLNKSDEESPSNHDSLYEALREINLAYLMLAHRMINEDSEWASYRLGLDNQMVDFLRRLTPSQIIHISGADYFLFRPRFQGTAIFDLLSQSAPNGGLKALHATLLMAQQQIEPASRSNHSA